jgi:hypothetical protein
LIPLSFGGMARFYFDTRDDDRLFLDGEGTELEGGLAAARLVAFATLTDCLKGRAPETDGPRLVSAEVSDGTHNPMMAAVVTVEWVPA